MIEYSILILLRMKRDIEKITCLALKIDTSNGWWFVLSPKSPNALDTFNLPLIRLWRISPPVDRILNRVGDRT